MIRLQLVLVIVLVAACGDQLKVIDGVACTDDAACALGGVTGSCQSSGFCAYPDDSCPDGLRYSPGASGMESTCVGAVSCGEEGGACCAGRTCGTNLVCGSDRVCSCGGFDEPCCGGNSCDTGFSCAQGSCRADVEQLAMGHWASCMLGTDGSVRCWGADMIKAGGESHPLVGTAVMPREITRINISNVAQIDRGDGHACARKQDGSVWCWGLNLFGQLGNGTTTPSRAPVQVSGLTATQISAGRLHSCAVGSVGGVAGIYCWGRNGLHSNGGDVSRLGNNDTLNSSTPVAVDMSQMAATGQTPKQVVAGGYHTCAIMSDDRVWCWGVNDAGRLGDGTSTSSKVPVLVSFAAITIPSGVTVDQLVIASMRKGPSGRTAIRLSNGQVYSWGDGNRGVHGDGTTSSRTNPTTPVDTTALSGATFKQIATSGDTMCGLDSTGKVWCWGSGYQGALGNDQDDEAETHVPDEVVGLPAGIVSIEGGHRATCAIDPSKHLWCWGSNRNGALTRVEPTTKLEGRLHKAIDVTP